MFKRLIKKFYKSKPHIHNMVIEQYSEDTCMGKKYHSRYICKECRWIDYESIWTNIKKTY